MGSMILILKYDRGPPHLAGGRYLRKGAWMTVQWEARKINSYGMWSLGAPRGRAFWLSLNHNPLSWILKYQNVLKY